MTDGVGRTDGRTDTDCPEGEAPTQPDPRDLARDWITVWQSELAAIATDREMREHWQAAVGVWTGLASAIVRDRSPPPPPPSAHDAAPRHAASRHPTPRSAGTSDATGTPAAAAPPDARDVEIERLGRHVAALEARLAAIEHDDAVGGALRRPRKRKA